MNTEDIKTQNVGTYILDLFNPLKVKTTDDIIKLFTLGLLAPIFIGIISYWDLTIIQLRDLFNPKKTISDYSIDIICFFLILSYLAMVIAFLKKKRIGWILTNAVCMCIVGVSLVLLSLALYWIITTAIFDSFSRFDIFNSKEFFTTIGVFVIPLTFIVSTNKKRILVTFRITKLLKSITIGSSIVFVILWCLNMLPDRFRDKGGPREYLPIEFYNRYDFPISSNDFLPLKTKNPVVEKLFLKAKSARLKYDFYEAILYFEEALKLEPNNTNIMLALSDSYAHDNDLETAVTFIDKAISIDSTNFGFYNDRGVLYYKMRKNDKALKNYKKALQIDSLNPNIYLNLSLVYYYEDMKEESFKLIIKAEKAGADKTTLNKYKVLIGFYE